MGLRVVLAVETEEREKVVVFSSFKNKKNKNSFIIISLLTQQLKQQLERRLGKASIYMRSTSFHGSSSSMHNYLLTGSTNIYSGLI